MRRLRQLEDEWARIFRWVRRKLAYTWAVIWRAGVKYDETDGEQRAASFAYYALFSLFPLLLLLITGATAFLGNREEAMAKILTLVSGFIPTTEGQNDWLVPLIKQVVYSRKSAGIIAFTVLCWSALRFFQALVRGVNKAWGTKEYSWWRLPIKNLAMAGILASALFLGCVAPPAVDLLQIFVWEHAWKLGLDWKTLDPIFEVIRQTLPSLVLFYGFSLFYKFAPRRRTPYREVWLASLLVTVGLQFLQHLFVYYTRTFADFTGLYGTLGGVVALLMWIYLSGSVIILGGCISAAQYEVRLSLTDQSERSTV